MPDGVAVDRSQYLFESFDRSPSLGGGWIIPKAGQNAPAEAQQLRVDVTTDAEFVPEVETESPLPQIQVPTLSICLSSRAGRTV